jgi:hypothetical protein
MDLQPSFRAQVRESFAHDERVWLAELARMYQQAFADYYRALDASFTSAAIATILRTLLSIRIHADRESRLSFPGLAGF